VTQSKSYGQWPRRLLESGFFAAVIATLWTLDTLTKIKEQNPQGGSFAEFQLYAHQVTSALAVLILIPAVAWWLNRFPLRRDRLLSAIIGHVLGSGLFAIAHYFLLVGMRFLVYPVYGYEFIFSDFWLQNLVFEYQKDIKIYLAVVGIIAAYRYYSRQEASAVSAKPDRLIVQTGSGETIIRQEDIEYLEAARNYVVVGTNAKEYLVRETLGRLEKTIATEHIVRTHRSYLVNIDRIEEIRSTDSGGHEIRMQSGKRIPLSRGYREKFKSEITS